MNIRLLVLLLSIAGLTAYAGEKEKSQIKSDKQFTLPDKSVLYSGNVVYIYSRDTITSDSLLVHKKSGDMTFTGNVNMKTYVTTKSTTVTTMNTDRLVMEARE